MADKGNGKMKKQVFLSENEKLKLHNLELRRSMLQMQAGALEAEQQALVDSINKRLKIDLDNYMVNTQTGELTLQLPQ